MSKKKRDWAQLPPDVLQEIATQLSEMTDLVRQRCACSPWRSSILIPNRPPHSVPWLLLPSKYSLPGKVRFFSLSEQRTYAIPLPEKFRNRQIFATPHGGCLIAVSYEKVANFIEFSVSLVNPITRFSVTFPPVSVFRLHMRFPIDENISLKLFQLSEADLLIGFFPFGYFQIFFCRPGDPTWSIFESAYLFANQPYDDFFVHNGSLFLVNQHTRRMKIITMENVCTLIQFPQCSFGNSYLVESPSTVGASE